MPAAKKERKVLCQVTLWKRPAMSAAVQAQQVKEGLHLAIVEIGGPNGRKVRGELLGPFDQESMSRPVWGEYEFSPTAPPA